MKIIIIVEDHFISDIEDISTALTHEGVENQEIFPAIGIIVGECSEITPKIANLVGVLSVEEDTADYVTQNPVDKS